MSDTAKSASLIGHKIRIEAEIVEGRLRERYLARMADDTWVEMATSDGVICLYGSQVSSQGNSVFSLPQEIQVSAMEVFATDHEMTQIFSAESCGIRVVRKIFLDGDDSWLRVTTRLEPSRSVELQSAADHLSFSQRLDYSYSPTVGGFNPDAQYKAPLILVQSKHLAFGVVPDVTALSRDALRLCSIATACLPPTSYVMIRAIRQKSCSHGSLARGLFRECSPSSD